MFTFLRFASLAMVSLSLVACGGGDKDHKDHDHKDHGHKDHSHKDEGARDGGHHHEGERFELGSVKAGAYEIVAVQIGKPAKGEGILAIKGKGLEKGAAVVRAWAGDESAQAAIKAKADYAPAHDDFDVHVETGDTLAAGAKWWIEVEPTGGDKVTVSFDIKK